MLNPDGSNTTSGAAISGDTPTLAAVRMLGGIIAGCRSVEAHRAHAAVDLRAIEDIQRKLEANPDDPGAKQWIRQLAQTWSYRVRDNTRSIRKILDLVETKTDGRR